MRESQSSVAEVLSGVHRRFELRMVLSGDTWEDIQRLAEEYGQAIQDRGPDCVNITTGGYSVGGYVFAVEDPEMTHDRWAEDLKSWLDERGTQ